MTREQARKYINPKLLSDDLIVLGDGDKVNIPVTDKLIDRLAEIELPKQPSKPA